jgi:predicted nucleic acid-binding Zn ribbon protein
VQGNKPGMQENKKAESETCKEIFQEGPRREKERRPFFFSFFLILES